MKIAILTANLGNFDTPHDLADQNLPPDVKMYFYRFTDENFPPIAGLTPRLQYRIPKMFGWEMVENIGDLGRADVFIWLDGSMTLHNPNSVRWFLQQLGNADMAFFRHPWRKTIREEVLHIEEKLKEGNKYITSRYENGLHLQQWIEIVNDPLYLDDKLYASTAFIYRNKEEVRDALKTWWFYQSRYFTCDQVPLPWILDRQGIDVNVINEDIFKSEHIALVSHHK